MTLEGIQTVAVAGGGTMGNGIAHVAARAGYKVILFDIEPKALERAVATIGRNMDREITRERLTQTDKEASLARILPTSRLEDLGAADFVIEAVAEDLSVKSKLFKTLDTKVRPNVILASNTSSISITKIAAQTTRPGKVIGMHFMNPVPVMALVEVVRGLATSRETSAITHELAQSLGKTPVEVQDYPGFVSNRVLMPMINEAIFAVMEGVGTPEAIDSVMKLGMNHPIGPLALADLIGLDICLNVLEVLQGGLGDPKYRPCPLLRKMVDAGHLGRKSGQGFYRY